MGFTGRFGTGNSRLGNILLSAVDIPNEGTFDFTAHQISSNQIRVVFDKKVSVSSALSLSNYELSIVDSLSQQILPSILYVKLYDSTEKSVLLQLDKNLTTNSTYIISLGEIFDEYGETVSSVSESFIANVICGPVCTGAYQSNNNCIDLVFDKNVGITTTAAIASISGLSGPSESLTVISWGSSISQKSVRFQINDLPISDEYIIHFSNITDESYNVSSGSVKLTTAIRMPKPFNKSILTRIQMTDAYVTDVSNDQINTSVIRVYFNGPALTSSSTNQTNWNITAQDIHKNQDDVNTLVEPPAYDLYSGISLAIDLIDKINSHYSEEQVHFYKSNSIPLIGAAGTPFSLSGVSYINDYLNVDNEISPGPFSESTGGFAFNGTGTQITVLDELTKSLVLYNLVSPWELNSGSYSGLSVQINPPISFVPKCIKWSNTGTRLFISFESGSEYILRFYSASSPFDISSLSFDGAQYTFPDGVGRKFHINSTGQYLIASSNTDQIHLYGFATPYYPPSLSLVNSCVISGINSIQGVFIEESSLFLLTKKNSSVYWSVIQYALPNVWDISSVTEESALQSLSLDRNINEIFWGDSGNKLYYGKSWGTEGIYQYNTLSVTEDDLITSALIIKSSYIGHLIDNKPHYVPDLVNHFDIKDPVTLTDAIDTLNKIKVSYTSHQTPSPVSFSTSYPFGGIIDRASMLNSTAYEINNEFTYFVDLHIISKSPYARYHISSTITSEDNLTVTDPLNATGYILSRSLEDLTKSISISNTKDGLNVYFDKQMTLSSSSFHITRESNPLNITYEISTSLPALNWAFNQLVYVYSLHINSNSGAVHIQNDIVNQVYPSDYENSANIHNLIYSVNSFTIKLNNHITSNSIHFVPDTNTVRLRPAYDHETLVSLMTDLINVFLEHNHNDGVHNGSGNRIFSAKMNDCLKITTQLIGNFSYELFGSINNIYFMNMINEPKECISNIKKVFDGYSEVPSLASVVPIIGISEDDGVLTLDSDRIELFFSKPMTETPINDSTIFVNNNLVTKNSSWKDDRTIVSEVLRMEEILYDVSISGLFDKAGNPVV